MKIHYINILLFELPLNILVYNQRNYYITPRHTQTNRSLCECELYSPANYDSDPEMKRVMQQFEDRTTQRFHEYDERMKTTRQKCKDRCDNEIQKIILKDKLEKQMEEQLTTLETKIDTDDIPTCICEKSLADKMEKGCLKCGGVLGSGIAPSVGLLGTVAIDQWKNAAILAAVKKGTDAGIATVVAELESVAEKFVIIGIDIGGMINAETYRCPKALITSIYAQQQKVCGAIGNKAFVCNRLGQDGTRIWFRSNVLEATKQGISAAETAEKAEIVLVNAKSSLLYSAIGYSVMAILIILLVMVIIYLILRYRRKKKMKKKLQYIKLLEE
ncbi:rifin [Plasmodium falciparum IGH-CR14]|uniref:Rifin n=1 Tax=Plasmodium falciparum IGH-CR14 TaxID=580059 RepID=A0A0L1IH08_PLAFA|nr:rifin [Plasmodium falciparum IGH-CR14]